MNQNDGYSKILVEIGVLKKSLENTDANVLGIRNQIDTFNSSFINNSTLQLELKSRDASIDELKNKLKWTTGVLWGGLCSLAGILVLGIVYANVTFN